MNISSLAGSRAVVVGGGWAGIAAAWRLREAGARVELLDAQDRLGGRSRDVRLGERSVTLGGKNIGKKYERFRRFVSEHGDGEWEHFGISTSQVERGKLVPVEGTARRRAIVHLLRKARPADIIRLVKFVRWTSGNPANRFLDGPAFRRATRDGDLPLAQAFGDHVARQLIRPMTMRMNGAEPDETFLGNLGTNLALVLDSFDQLVDGFDPVFAQFSKTITVHNSTTATAIRHHSGSIRGVAYVKKGTEEGQIDADIVILAIPAAAAASLMTPLDAPISAALSSVPYHPVGVAVVEYDADIFGDVGRAVVLPEGRVLSNAGAYGKEDRRTVRYTFSGRPARSFLTREPDTEELLRVGEHELGLHLPLREAQAVHAVSQVWQQGLCSYGPDHHVLTEKLRRASGDIPGLSFAGDYVAGASIEACFVSAERAIDALTSTAVPETSS